MKNLLKFIFTLLLVPFFIKSYGEQYNGTSCLNSSRQAITISNSQDSIHYKLIPGLSNTYGYDIFIGLRKIIHQPSIPGISGSKGFARRLDAVKVARLVAEKLRHGIMPPAVTEEEMQALGVKL